MKESILVAGVAETLSRGNLAGASENAAFFYDAANYGVTTGGVPSLDLTEGHGNSEIDALWDKKPLTLRWLVESQQNKFKRVLEIAGFEASTKTLIDLGCGNGRLLGYIKDKFGIIATGITISKNQYKYCNENKLGNVKLCSFLGLNDTFPNQDFDIVTALGSLEHAVRLDDADDRKKIWRDTFESIRSISKKDTRFITTTIHFREDYVPRADSLELSLWQILRLPNNDLRKIFGPVCNQTLDCWYPIEYNDGTTEFTEATKGLFKLERTEDRTEDYRRTSVAWGMSYANRLKNPLSWPYLLRGFIANPREVFWASIDIFGQKQGLAFWSRQFVPSPSFGNLAPCKLRFDVWRAI